MCDSVRSGRSNDVRRTAVMSALARLQKEDPLGYFAEPVDESQVPGYREVVSLDDKTHKMAARQK